MKKIHLAIQLKAKGLDRWRAIHVALPENENVLAYLKDLCTEHVRPVTANVWPAKECDRNVDFWNAEFQKQGRFIEWGYPTTK